MQIDYSKLSEEDASKVKKALEQDEEFYGYIPDNGMRFILDNYAALFTIGHLERNWMQAYVQSHDFNHVPLETLKNVFDACDRAKLHELYPVPLANNSSKTECWSLFRGCAGDDHRRGMSWTSSLSKALWYAAWHKAHKGLNNCCVYAIIVERKDIYCYLEENEPEYIVFPESWWKIDIPQNEFNKLDRPR